MTRHVVSAHTTNSNTAESDRQRFVEHTVALSDGSEVRIFATDPMDAIEKVRRNLAAEAVR